MLAACEELGVSFVAYSPLGRGFLVGNFRRAGELPAADHRRSHPRFQDGAADLNAALVVAVEQIAVDLGATAAQVAIAWVLSRSAQVLTIPGMKTRKHLADNLGAAALQLSAGNLARLDGLAASVQGERHPPAMMQILDR
jgi:aryl-alcohol dehydrogenase-like predicted oxidoreductase